MDDFLAPLNGEQNFDDINSGMNYDYDLGIPRDSTRQLMIKRGKSPQPSPIWGRNPTH